jgi:hypothetical protein
MEFSRCDEIDFGVFFMCGIHAFDNGIADIPWIMHFTLFKMQRGSLNG